MRATIYGWVALGVLLLAGCGSSDVGKPCTLRAAQTDPSLQGNVPADFVEIGNPGCDDLICIKSPGPAGSNGRSYCSTECVSNSDCGDSGLVCRPVTVDATFLATLSQSAQDQYKKLLNCPDNVSLQQCAQNSTYCAVPVQ